MSAAPSLAEAAALLRAAGYTVTKPSGLDALPPRSRDVALLLLDPLSAKEIGRRLGMAPGTVKHHLGKVYRHLGVEGQLQAMVRVREILGASRAP